jgi:prefoldin subunit 5
MNQEAIEARRRDIERQLRPLRAEHATITATIERLESEKEALQRREGRWDVS